MKEQQDLLNMRLNVPPKEKVRDRPGTYPGHCRITIPLGCPPTAVNQKQPGGQLKDMGLAALCLTKD